MDPRIDWRRLAAAGLIVTVLAAAGCTPDRAPASPGRGGNPSTTVLRLATIDNVAPGGESEFINAVEDVSDGRLTFEVVTEYGDAVPEAESDLVRAVADGSLDLGIASTRAYARAGIPGLQAFEAPLLLDTHASVLEVVQGGVGREVLSSLEDDGLTGLALLHGGLRRPFAADAPLLTPQDWQGVRFRVFNSPVQEAAVAAVGGTPVNVSYQWVEEVRADRLDAAEFNLVEHSRFDLGDQVRYVTPNVVLWPRVDTIVIGTDRWERLSEQERGWLTSAAERAVGANLALDRAENTAVTSLCDEGVRLVPASDVQLRQLNQAMRPVQDALAADEKEAPLLAALEEVAARHDGPEVPRVPTDCQDVDGTAQAAEATGGQDPIPAGTYRMSASQDELTEAGVDNGPGWSGTWTMKVQDGLYELTCAPVDRPGKDCGNFTGPTNEVLERGPVLPVEDGVRLAYDLDPEGDLDCEGCANSDGYVVSWTLEGDQLVLRHVGPGSEAWQWTFKPWTRID